MLSKFLGGIGLAYHRVRMPLSDLFVRPATSDRGGAKDSGFYSEMEMKECR